MNHIYINNYEDFIKYNVIFEKILIIEKNKCVGYIKLSKDLLMYDIKNEKLLFEYINYYKVDKTIQYINKLTNETILNYDINKIIEDIIQKCYISKKELNIYDLPYNEYLLQAFKPPQTEQEALLNECSYYYYILNLLDFSFSKITEEFINNRIITYNLCKTDTVSIHIKNKINISIVEDIIDSLISNERKIEYKKFIYNLIVKPNGEQNIFYDYNECYLTTWICEIFNKIHTNDIINPAKNRYQFIDGELMDDIEINKQIDEYVVMGCKNFIIKKKDIEKTKMNVDNFNNYLRINDQRIIDCITNEIYYIYMYNSRHTLNEFIFMNGNILFTNFLKWCTCVCDNI
jgi:hypothetical protein